MKELIHIRHKINARIKSIGDDPQAMYAKKMMRRCIKDIDAVIDAKKVTGEVAKCKTPLDRFNEAIGESPIAENPMWNKLLNETLLSKKQQERFDTLYEFLRRGRISEEFFLSSMLDSTI
tara:strand:+ start:166 stop:525 length:360 start_codon:yes stop_codon:yes gene_type:complete